MMILVRPAAPTPPANVSPRASAAAGYGLAVERHLQQWRDEAHVECASGERDETDDGEDDAAGPADGKADDDQREAGDDAHVVYFDDL